MKAVRKSSRARKKLMLQSGVRVANPVRRDPTRTGGVRLRFTAELNRRFAMIVRDLRDAVVRDDVLGLDSPRTLASPGKKAFAYSTSAGKMKNFSRWVDGQFHKYLLSLGGHGLVPTHGATVANSVSPWWADTYLESGYKTGVVRSVAALKKYGKGKVPHRAFGGTLTTEEAVATAFASRTHADAAGLIYSRSFEELKGITADMSRQINRSLAESLAEGRGAAQTAAILEKRVHVGLARARVMARTEIIRAHHHASINTFREAGVYGVQVVVEFHGALDDRICPECADLHGQLFTLDEILPMIPVHPNCRCAALPVPQLMSDQEVAEARAEEQQGAFVIPGSHVVENYDEQTDEDE
jgi:SPP1 gp7 family putative phage head morphogenesis protein